ncbi:MULTISPECIES: tyrosine-type recombinase/integrase [Bacteroides]|uniref:tyrosine-type recombinase/integrase n=1 Tax=Bacteroides TaxID=816 RepID=UPI0025908AA5|nr:MULTISPECIES: tyrosine-type recombinase/integrase [Bacteroides]
MFHLSRHSYATLCLSMGVPIETISQTLGHRSISTAQIYADITRTKINEDMTNLAERIERHRRNFPIRTKHSAYPFAAS